MQKAAGARNAPTARERQIVQFVALLPKAVPIPSVATLSVVAIPHRADLDTVVRTTALTVPFAARTSFTETVMSMPTMRATLARAMVSMNLNEIARDAIRELPDAPWSRAGDRGCHRQNAHCGERESNVPFNVKVGPPFKR
jgi:hypothetical protein